MESFTIFVEYRMRLGSAKTVETMFLRLVVALAFHYICQFIYDALKM